jgi:predicted enzyme related to lactoylglutathione lyase
MKNNPVAWFEIYCQDLDRAQKFYETVFQAKLTKLDAPFPGIELLAFPSDMTTPGAPGALVKMQGFTSRGSSTLVYFGCDDCTVEEARVKAAGGRVEKPKMSIGPYGNISLVIDTEGNMVGLHSMK